MKNIVIFASGSGSNFEAIQKSILEGKIKGKIVLLICNKKDAYVIKRAEKYKIPVKILSEKEFEQYDDYVNELIETLEEYKTDLIVLAGYLRKVPDKVVKRYKGKIINIHPALLPEFGGKGMYGMNVHRKVLESGKKVSGVTIHFVDEEYDHGPIIVQEKVKIDEDETPESLAEKIHKIEHRLYPWVIKKLCEDKIKLTEKNEVKIYD